MKRAGRAAGQAAAFISVAALAACATTPAPVLRGRTPHAALPPVPYDPDGPPRVVEGGGPVQCVPFARTASGVQIYGDAHTWWGQAAGRYPRSNSPAPGSVLVMRGYQDASRGHVAVVTAIVSPRVIRVDQANWLNRGEVTIGVPVIDVSPANDWTEVRVWHIPTGAWGARVYQAEGFIHAFLLPTLS